MQENKTLYRTLLAVLVVVLALSAGAAAQIPTYNAQDIKWVNDIIGRSDLGAKYGWKKDQPSTWYGWVQTVSWAESPGGTEYRISKINLTSVKISGTLDLSRLTELTDLNCDYTSLEKLDLTNCPKLTKLSCNIKTLKSLDVSNCPELTYLSCYGAESLKALDVSKCTKLEQLIGGLSGIEALDVTKCPALWNLNIGETPIKALDVTHCPELRELFCHRTEIAALDVSRCPELYDLRCYDTNIDALDVTNCTKLTTLFCDKTAIRTLDVTKCAELTHLGIGTTQIKTLDLSKSSQLRALGCAYSQIEALDLSKCQVTELGLGHTSIRYLKLSSDRGMRIEAVPAEAGTTQVVKNDVWKSYYMLSATPKSGYVFKEWVGLPERVYTPSVEFIMLDQWMTLQAVFEPAARATPQITGDTHLAVSLDRPSEIAFVAELSNAVFGDPIAMTVAIGAEKASVTADKNGQWTFVFTAEQVGRLRVGWYDVLASCESNALNGFVRDVKIGTLTVTELPIATSWSMPKKLTVVNGFTKPLIVVTPAGAGIPADLRFTVAGKAKNRRVAVDRNGVVTGLKAGKNNVTVKQGKTTKTCAVTVAANRFARKKPLTVKGESGLFASTKSLKYKDGRLACEIFLYNNTGEKIASVSDVTVELRIGDDVVLRKAVGEWAFRGALKNKSNKVYALEIAPDEWPDGLRLPLNLTDKTVHALLTGVDAQGHEIRALVAGMKRVGAAPDDEAQGEAEAAPDDGAQGEVEAVDVGDDDGAVG